MKTWTQLRALTQSLSNNDDATQLTVFDQLLNDGVRMALGAHEWPFLEKTATIATVASQQFYQLPYDYGQLISIVVTIGNTQYVPMEAPNRNFWNLLNTQTSITSDIPQYYYIFGGTIGLYPTPASTAGTYTVSYKKAVRDMSIVDYTAGSIVSVANGGTAVVGTGTTWTTPMAGRMLRITNSDTANRGDGFWYEIASVGSNTALTLTDLYGGVTIAASTAPYTIGQVSVLPENYQQLPVWYTLAQYWSSTQSDQNKYLQFQGMFDSGVAQMLDEFGKKSTSPTIDYGPRRGLGTNPNLYLRNVGP